MAATLAPCRVCSNASVDHVVDSIIIGGGPAGLSASIYIARYNRSVLVVDDGYGRSTSHEVNENYLGFPDGVGARDLRVLGRAQAERFGARFHDGRAESIERRDGAFVTTTGAGAFRSRTLILATGVLDEFPAFEGIEAYVGRSLFWCITCDGWKTRGKRVLVIGLDDEAATTTLQFQNFTDDVSILTNCDRDRCRISPERRQMLERAGVPVLISELRTVHGADGMVEAVETAAGDRIACDVLISHQGATPNAGLARSLGADIDDAGYVIVDNEQRTNVPMLYAAGDLTRPFSHQIVSAAHEGATAAQAANYDLYRPEQRS